MRNVLKASTLESKFPLLSAYASYGHYNDMDMLEIGRTLSPSEEEAHFGMWCIMSSPLLIGCDLTSISGQSLQLLKNKELIAINQDTLGLQAHIVQHDNNSYVLTKDIKTLRGLERAVALYNPSDEPTSVTIPFSAIEFSGKVSVRNIIKQEELGVFTESFTSEIPAHGTLILTVKGESRLEPTIYEAEWAILGNFQRYNNREAAHYIKDQNETISGKTKIGYLGGYPENYIQWNDVYSQEGGNYKLSIVYISGVERNLTLTINDEVYELEKLKSESWDTSDIHSIDINLKYNTHE